MAVSIPQLKKAAAMIADSFGISSADSLQIIQGLNNDGEKINAILAGDFSAVAASVGVAAEKTAGGSAVGVNTKNRKAARKEKHNAINNHAAMGQYKPVTASNNKDDINMGAASPDVIQADIVGTHELPPDFSETVRGWLFDIQAREGWEDLCKISSLQWRAACMYVGERVKHSKLLFDLEKLRTRGGSIIYDPYKVEKIIPIWNYYTCIYKHVPLVADFISFAGVSTEWLYDSEGRGLTSSRVELLQKVRKICETGIESALTDFRENPTGRIFTAKARYGWRETSEIVHTSTKELQTVAALPVFDDGGGLLTAEK